MTLVDELRRPAARRIAHTVTVLSAPVWAPLALIAVVLGLLSVFADWLLENTLQGFDKVKWVAFDAYVKRWPAVAPSGIVIPPLRAGCDPLFMEAIDRGDDLEIKKFPLEGLLDKARERVMSPQEIAEQRVNWANQLHD